MPTLPIFSTFSPTALYVFKLDDLSVEQATSFPVLDFHHP